MNNQNGLSCRFSDFRHFSQQNDASYCSRYFSNQPLALDPATMIQRAAGLRSVGRRWLHIRYQISPILARNGRISGGRLGKKVTVPELRREAVRRLLRFPPAQVHVPRA
jgi:hypothetical protein